MAFSGPLLFRALRHLFAFLASTLKIRPVVHHHMTAHFAYEPLALRPWHHQSKVVILNAIRAPDWVC